MLNVKRAGGQWALYMVFLQLLTLRTTAIPSQRAPQKTCPLPLKSKTHVGAAVEAQKAQLERGRGGGWQILQPLVVSWTSDGL